MKAFLCLRSAASCSALIGVGVLFLGQFLYQGPLNESGGSGLSLLSLLGMIACIGAALSYGFAVAFGQRFGRQGLSPAQGALGQLCGSSLIMLPLMLGFDQPWLSPAPSLAFWGSIVGLALLSTALAYLLYFWLIAQAGATNAALVTLLIPASAMVLGALFLQEGFGVYDLLASPSSAWACW